MRANIKGSLSRRSTPDYAEPPKLLLCFNVAFCQRDAAESERAAGTLSTAFVANQVRGCKRLPAKSRLINWGLQARIRPYNHGMSLNQNNPKLKAPYIGLATRAGFFCWSRGRAFE